MTTSVREAGTAAPTPAAVQLPTHLLVPFRGITIAVRAVANAIQVPSMAPARLGVVILGTHSGQDPRQLTPSEARQLAVYLVDCANALDNPADRVIVDEAEGIGHE